MSVKGRGRHVISSFAEVLFFQTSQGIKCHGFNILNVKGDF